MKYILLVTLALSSSAFAIDFNKATGTFDIKEKNEKIGDKFIAEANFGSFDFNDNSRMPASLPKKAATSVTEMTGSFED